MNILETHDLCKDFAGFRAGGSQGGVFQSLRDAPDVVTGTIFVVVVLGFRRGLGVTLRSLLAIWDQPTQSGSPQALSAGVRKMGSQPTQK